MSCQSAPGMGNEVLNKMECGGMCPGKIVVYVILCLDLIWLFETPH
ncbi:unnamed protein product, partial [Staurois parvus]